MISSMYCLYVGFDYTYMDINVLEEGIKSCFTSQVWFQAVAGDRTYHTDSPAITRQPHHPFGHRYIPVYVCMYVCVYVCTCVCMGVCTCVSLYACVY